MISGQQLSCTLAVQKDREGMMYRRYTVKQLSELAEGIRIAREKEKETEVKEYTMDYDTFKKGMAKRDKIIRTDEIGRSRSILARQENR